jgi:hypothetical protein
MRSHMFNPLRIKRSRYWLKLKMKVTSYMPVAVINGHSSYSSLNAHGLLATRLVEHVVYIRPFMDMYVYLCNGIFLRMRY